MSKMFQALVFRSWELEVFEALRCNFAGVADGFTTKAQRHEKKGAPATEDTEADGVTGDRLRVTALGGICALGIGRGWTADCAGIGLRPDRADDRRELKLEQIRLAQKSGCRRNKTASCGRLEQSICRDVPGGLFTFQAAAASMINDQRSYSGGCRARWVGLMNNE